MTVSGRLLLTLGLYGLGLVAVLIGFALLERVGLPERFIGAGILALIVATYVGAGFFGRTMRSEAFVLAGRRLPADFTGLAAAADWLPGTVLLAILGGLILDGGAALAWILGWAAGLVVMAALVVPGIRRDESESVPDYLAGRFGGRPARLFGLIILLITAILFLAAEAGVIGAVVDTLFGIGAGRGIWIAFAALVICVMLGGMGAVVTANAGQVLVILAALVVPAVLISLNLADTAVPHRAIGTALAARTDGLAPTAAATTGLFEQIALMLTVMAGTAAMPHLVGRYLVTPGALSARRAVVWSLLFLVLLLIATSTYAVFAGWQVQDALAGRPPSGLPGWVFQLGRDSLLQICGIDAVSAAAISAACLFAGDGPTIPAGQIAIAPIALLAAAPRAAELPFVIVGLAATGALTAAMATANGLLLALGNAVCGDLYRGVFGQRASAGRRLLIGRIVVIAAAALAVWAADRQTVAPLTLVAWTFSLAGAGLLPVLVLGLWWRGLGRVGALAGMAAGFGVTASYIVGTEFGWIADWTVFGLVDTGVSNQVAAIFGLPLGALVTVLAGLAVDERRLIGLAGPRLTTRSSEARDSA